MNTLKVQTTSRIFRNSQFYRQLAILMLCILAFFAFVIILIKKFYEAKKDPHFGAVFFKNNNVVPSNEIELQAMPSMAADHGDTNEVTPEPESHGPSEEVRDDLLSRFLTRASQLLFKKNEVVFNDIIQLQAISTPSPDHETEPENQERIDKERRKRSR